MGQAMGNKKDFKKIKFICEEVAQQKSYQEISDDWVKQNPDERPISKQMVNYYIRSNKPVIQDIRQQLMDRTLEKAMEIPIANEKTRLTRMEALYLEANKIESVKDKIGVSLDCLREARQEVKGETTTQNYLQFNQFNELTDAQLLDKKKELEQKFIELSKKGDTYAQVPGS